MKHFLFLIPLLLSILLGTAQERKYSPYVPQLPDNYVQLLSAKQKQYEKNVTELQELVGDCQEAVTDLIIDYPEKGKIANEQFQKYLKSLNECKCDFGDFTIFTNAKQGLKTIKSNVRIYREQARQEERQKLAQERQIRQQITTVDSTYSDVTYNGSKEVYTSAPFYDRPSMVTGKVIYNVPEYQKIEIINRYDFNYYLVKCNGIKGYIHKGMIKTK